MPQRKSLFGRRPALEPLDVEHTPAALSPEEYLDLVWGATVLGATTHPAPPDSETASADASDALDGGVVGESDVVDLRGHGESRAAPALSPLEIDLSALAPPAVEARAL